MRRRFSLPAGDDEIDLVPLIDCVFLLLLFFMLCGQLSVSERAEHITVPPAQSAQLIPTPDRWRHEVLNVGGGPRELAVRLRLGSTLDTAGLSQSDALTRLRHMLDRLHAFSTTYRDHASGLEIPQVVMELRVDADVPWRAVQAVEQVLADSIDPLTGLGKVGARRPFIHLTFSVRDPADG